MFRQICVLLGSAIILSGCSLLMRPSCYYTEYGMQESWDRVFGSQKLPSGVKHIDCAIDWHGHGSGVGVPGRLEDVCLVSLSAQDFEGVLKTRDYEERPLRKIPKVVSELAQKHNVTLTAIYYDREYEQTLYINADRTFLIGYVTRGHTCSGIEQVI